MSTAVVDATAEHIPAIQTIYAHWVLHGLASFEEVPPEASEMDRRRLCFDRRRKYAHQRVEFPISRGDCLAGQLVS